MSTFEAKGGESEAGDGESQYRDSNELIPVMS